MTKRASKRRAAAEPAADVSELTRNIVDAPDAALTETLHSIDLMEREFLPLMRARIAAGTGLPELGPGWSAEELPLIMRWLPQSWRRRADALTGGKAQADAIRWHLERYEVGGLRRYLKKHPASPECLVWLLAENRRLTQALATSEAASKAASMKNKAERDFVANAWATREDKAQSKASFARMVAHEVKRKFGVAVTPDRIARYWLPKE